jgi:hypothetical protein
MADDRANLFARGESPLTTLPRCKLTHRAPLTISLPSTLALFDGPMIGSDRYF